MMYDVKFKKNWLCLTFNVIENVEAHNKLVLVRHSWLGYLISQLK